jgi:hypothetical protein
LQYDNNFHAAWTLDYDITAKKLNSTHGVFLWQNTEYGDFYFRSNCLNRFVGLGRQWSQGGNKASAEVQYDFKNKNVGVAGLPLFFRFGQEVVRDSFNWTARVNFGSEYWFYSTLKWNLTPNVKLTYNERSNLRTLFTGKGAFKFQTGLALELKL